MLLHLCVLIGALYAIIKTSDLFIDLAGSLGKRLGLKEYFIGSLIVGIGTSLPELFTSLAAVFQDERELVLPTVYGTIIANLGAGFGLGVLALFVWVRTDTRLLLFTRRHAYARGFLNISPAGSDRQFLVPIIVAALSVVLSVLLCLDGAFSRGDAGIFMLGYVGFFCWELWRRNLGGPDDSDVRGTSAPQMATGPWWQHAARILAAPVGMLVLFVWAVFRYWPQDHLVAGQISDSLFLIGLAAIVMVYCVLFYWWHRSGDPAEQRAEFSEFMTRKFRGAPITVTLILLAISIALVYLSGVVTVNVLLALSDDLGIGGPVLAASALAIGTSLPDIVVALNVARRGLHRMLTGHILQSNIFDVFLIMGVCGLIGELPDTFTGSARISLSFSVLMTLPLLLTIRTRRVSPAAAIALVFGTLLFLGLVILYG
ncbi:MAG: hypothetical protein OXU68_04715 [Bacteroidota bacterium]|nr:hypothetical protein [Bacteroidota bacterium]